MGEQLPFTRPIDKPVKGRADSHAREYAGYREGERKVIDDVGDPGQVKAPPAIVGHADQHPQAHDCCLDLTMNCGLGLADQPYANCAQNCLSPTRSRPLGKLVEPGADAKRIAQQCPEDLEDKDGNHGVDGDDARYAEKGNNRQTLALVGQWVTHLAKHLGKCGAKNTLFFHGSGHLPIHDVQDAADPAQDYQAIEVVRDVVVGQAHVPEVEPPESDPVRVQAGYLADAGQLLLGDE